MQFLKKLLLPPALLLLAAIGWAQLLLSPKELLSRTRRQRTKFQPQKPLASPTTSEIILSKGEQLVNIDYGRNYIIHSVENNYSVFLEFCGEPSAFSDGTFAIHYKDKNTAIRIWQGGVWFSKCQKYMGATLFPSREIIIFDAITEKFMCAKNDPKKALIILDSEELNALTEGMWWPVEFANEKLLLAMRARIDT